MRELNDAFALALRDMRHQANLAQSDFPPRVSREYISLLERGLRSPSLGIPRALGHPFHEHLDSDSTLTWTLIPRPLGH
ncbi:PbsX family transcriptional regulator [Pseudomonas fluorescens]|uniref:PbsX family transcriptional regulator n=1 Tax=Pseudomonas fluorescens TaxID=294 RepID=A0A379IK12_PSEFL|nr:PbsX family transcriptional regulator [Pseudomonas fluorescens]